MIPKKKFPPYSKNLSALIHAGYRPKGSISLFIGNYAWQKGATHFVSHPTQTLVLPAWLCPYNFSWPVKQCEVMVIDTGFAEIDYIEDIAIALFTDEASSVLYFSPNNDITFYKKDFSL